jgi:hypothetical protein
MQNKTKTTPPEANISTAGCMIAFLLILFLFAPLAIFMLQILHNDFELKPYLLWSIPYGFLLLIALLYKLLKKKSNQV